ncbi:MAG TPA: 2-phosphosulfolactate phosphatase [Acetobacteraceae bacterium]|nr:2-phosphosulfolactate phosphatase [Acetobacteraceae bacterium]
MEVRIESLLEGARRAAGSVAIIDVLRAFTTAAVALANGASHIVMVSGIEEAIALRRDGIVQVCVGEVGARAPAGFDFGNSPLEVSRADLRGKAIAQRTSAGTQGIAAASRAERRYAASLVTAGATARALRAGAPGGVPGRITLVAMGKDGTIRTDEDELCALHLRNLLEGRKGNRDAVRALILAGGEVPRYHDPARPYLHAEDLEIALDIDRYDFAIRVGIEDGRTVGRMLRPED